MCGIAGTINLDSQKIPELSRRLQVMNDLQKHRGPDGEGIWQHQLEHVGFGHRRLSIIDLTSGSQPMKGPGGTCITFNGEIYNFIELRQELGTELFVTTSDTETILHAYQKWGHGCVTKLQGMFAFALWDEANSVLFCARDRFGIKPFYYTLVGNTFYFASEVKALLPFIADIETDIEGFKDYLAFQLCLNGKTLFKNIRELLPGHTLTIKGKSIEIKRYWEVYFNLDLYHTEKFFEEELKKLFYDSVRLHLRSDVPLGAYISGGVDSSLVASLAQGLTNWEFKGFHGKFSYGSEYDESQYAHAVARDLDFEVHEIDITVEDFINHIQKVIYHLDFPVAGPGSFPQYMVSMLASKYRKVVLGGQGGDEIFGGYVRYLIAYFEQCIKGAIEGTMHSGNFIVTYESIIPNLVALRGYKPMLQEFWREGLFEDLDKRYFRLINRAPLLKNEINWDLLSDYSPYETFISIFNGENVPKESYFDRMTHFDFKTLLPALLQVEDRVSMAHGLESRVPFLDHPIVELAATIPANIKFKGGTMKHILKKALGHKLPVEIMQRKDKMGFPVPLTEWMQNEARDFVMDIFSSRQALSRDLVNNKSTLQGLQGESKFGRKIWGLFSIELWNREFHDQAYKFRDLLK
jgi:asparagine synthase (glutamine-hydrolysing)